METFRKHHDLEMKQMKLQRRRSELAKLLKDENIEYENQLRSLSKDDISNLMKMREQVDTLRSARESDRQRFADEKIYEHWRLNNPAIRKAESENLRNYVTDSWREQLSDKSLQNANDRAQQAEWDRQLLSAAREESARMASEAQTRRAMEAEYRANLKVQAEEVALRENEARVCKVEERAIIEELAFIEKLKKDRLEAEAKRQREEHGKLLKRQHTARLLRISRQVQAELEADKELLEHLSLRQLDDEGKLSAQRETARADVSWMKKTIEEQIKLEKQREAELEQLYADEAEREWQKREEEWRKERLARERLMQEVLKERKLQLEEKFNKLVEKEKELVNERIELDEDIDQIKFDKAREKLVDQRDRDLQRVGLEEQMAQRREVAASNAISTRLEADAEEKLADDMDDLVRIETARLRSARGNKQSFEPMVYLVLFCFHI